MISDFDQRDAYYHSTFMPIGSSWKGRSVSEGDFSVFDLKKNGDSLQLVGSHNRILNHLLNRKLDVGLSSIKLVDSVRPATKCRHRFIVPKDAKIRFQGESGCVLVHDFTISPSNNEKIEIIPIKVIHKEVIFSGLAVDFISEGDFSCEIVLLDGRVF